MAFFEYNKLREMFIFSWNIKMFGPAFCSNAMWKVKWKMLLAEVLFRKRQAEQMSFSVHHRLTGQKYTYKVIQRDSWAIWGNYYC